MEKMALDDKPSMLGGGGGGGGGATSFAATGSSRAKSCSIYD